jgi:hypothetical protein
MVALTLASQMVTLLKKSFLNLFIRNLNKNPFNNNLGADPPFQVEPTTYDYDAPMTEAGDITSKYMAIRSVISKVSLVKLS